MDIKKLVLATIERHLLTPLGIRTLSPEHPDYCALYHGPPENRDRAYHQGTVWTWLTGHYVEAALNCADNKTDCQTNLKQYFKALFSDHLEEAVIGSISEIFDADPPHYPKGCTAQAWSVAEVIRTWDLLQAGGAA